MEYFQLKQPVRMCISLTESSPYWDAPKSTLEHVLKEIGCGSSCSKEAKFLVEQKWEKHVFLIYDFFYADYDQATAHLPEKNRIPVLKVDSRAEMTIQIAKPAFRARVNRDVAWIHNVNGYDAGPPYLDDHSGGQVPVHKEPRDVDLLN